MIDLAGSERAAQTQNTGRRMMEGIELVLNRMQTFQNIFIRISLKENKQTKILI